MSKKIIEKEFKDAIWKQGFSLEQNVFRILEKDGWSILPNRNFFDSLSGNTREFDLLAFKSKRQRGVTLFTILIIECKFNPCRIVFYVRPIEQQLCLPQFYVGDFIKNKISQREINSFFDKIKQFKIFFKDSEQIFGYQIFEKIEKNEINKITQEKEKRVIFKTRQELSEKIIFGAINNVIQATLYEEKIRDKALNTAKFLMYFPVVIFSGDLFKASLGDRKNLKFQNIFHYRSGIAFSGDESPDEFDIHICDISTLRELLKAFNYVHKQFSKQFFKKIKDS